MFYLTCLWTFTSTQIPRNCRWGLLKIRSSRVFLWGSSENIGARFPLKTSVGKSSPIGSELHSLLYFFFPSFHSHLYEATQKYTGLLLTVPADVWLSEAKLSLFHWHTTKLSWRSNFQRDCFRALHLCHGCMSFPSGQDLPSKIGSYTIHRIFFFTTLPAGS